MSALHPQTAEELAEVIATAAAHGERLALRGGGSKDGVGRTEVAGRAVMMSAFAGVVDYDPAELVLTVRPATPLAEIEALVAGEGQMLAFEPFDHGPIFGRPAGRATIGGVVAAGVAGSRRLSAGGTRDHLLGFTAVSGRGEVFTAGGKVVKNVTGYDLPKLMCGSWGRLAAMTELTLKVLPRPRESLTFAARGLAPAGAQRLMNAAMGSIAAVAAAAHGGGLTALRLEGVGPSISARAAVLRAIEPGLEALSETGAAWFWTDLRTLAPLAGETLWRISLPAGAWPRLAAEGAALVDWAGQLVWLASDEPAAGLRDRIIALGGHAMLVRGGDPGVPAFHPQVPPLAALEARVRRAFDPVGVFETGRFGEDL